MLTGTQKNILYLIRKSLKVESEYEEFFTEDTTSVEQSIVKNGILTIVYDAMPDQAKLHLTVELLCENKLMGSIIDKFGSDVQTEVIDPEHFKATVSVELSGVFFGWVIASQGMMKIVGPEEVASQFQNIIRLYLPENR